MFAAGSYRRAAGDESPLFSMAAEAVLFLTGPIIAFKAYRPDR